MSGWLADWRSGCERAGEGAGAFLWLAWQEAGRGPCGGEVCRRAGGFWRAQTQGMGEFEIRRGALASDPVRLEPASSRANQQRVAVSRSVRRCCNVMQRVPWIRKSVPTPASSWPAGLLLACPCGRSADPQDQPLFLDPGDAGVARCDPCDTDSGSDSMQVRRERHCLISCRGNAVAAGDGARARGGGGGWVLVQARRARGVCKAHIREGRRDDERVEGREEGRAVCARLWSGEGGEGERGEMTARCLRL